jgi:peptidoglycan/LPS O-acetylase OafA/YrhL
MDTLATPLVTPSPTQKRFYFPELDGLRFLAFLLVFIHHNRLFTQFLSPLRTNGWIGVDLFFVLSAYLFTRILIAEYNKTGTINYRKFLIRRIFRIWPVYYLLVALCFVWYLKINGFNQLGLIRLVGLSTFTDNILAAFYGDYNRIFCISHLWTIGYEEQFYIFVPLIIYYLIRSKYKWHWIIGAAVLQNLVRLIFIAQHVPHPAIYVLPITHFESIILGIVIGFGGFDKLLGKVNAAIIGLAGIALFICLQWTTEVTASGYGLILTYTFAGISTSFVLFAVLHTEWLKKFLSNQVLVFLGKRSYGLYLFHCIANSLAETAIRKAWIPASNFSYFIYSLVMTIIFAILSYKLIETPFLKLKKKYEVVESRPI